MAFPYLFDRLSSQVQFEKKQMSLTEVKLKTVHTGVFNHQPIKHDWITSTDKLKSRCKDVQEYVFDKDIWSLFIE